MAFERLRDRWENMAPREKRLVLALGVTGVVCVLGFVWLQVSSSLNRLETRNAQVRNALRLIAEHQDDILEKRNSPEDPERVIPETAQPLQTYVESVASQAGNMTIPESSERPPLVKGKYRELALDLKLNGVTLDQLAKFLKLVEQAPGVVTQRLYVKPYISAHDKLTVELSIAAYEKVKSTDKVKKGAGKPGKSGEDESDKSGG